jgi:hypothetical protein
VRLMIIRRIYPMSKQTLASGATALGSVLAPDYPIYQTNLLASGRRGLLLGSGDS